MKVEINKLLIALTIMVPVPGLLASVPETTELREPEAIRVVKPIVPSEFSRYNITGDVEVTFNIDDTGDLYNIEVEQASHPEFAESVKNALRGWRFERPEVEGVRYRLQVLFN